MNTLLLPTSIISLPSLSFWMIAGILLIRQENNRNHNREYIIREWARDPGDLYYKGDTAVILPVLENYVKDILTTFKMIRELCCGIYIMSLVVRVDIDTVKEVCRYYKRYLRGDEQ